MNFIKKTGQQKHTDSQIKRIKIFSLIAIFESEMEKKTFILHTVSKHSQHAPIIGLY